LRGAQPSHFLGQPRVTGRDHDLGQRRLPCQCKRYRQRMRHLMDLVVIEEEADFHVDPMHRSRESKT
jgi:hypothetical protein